MVSVVSSCGTQLGHIHRDPRGLATLLTGLKLSRGVQVIDSYT